MTARKGTMTLGAGRLRAMHAKHIRDNPVLDYLNARSWRQFRRWGWVWALPALALFGVFVTVEIVSIMSAYYSAGESPARSVAMFGVPVVGALLFLPTLSMLSGVNRLLRKQNLEQLLLTRIEPMQIWVAALIHFNRRALLLLALTAPPLALIAAVSGLPPWLLAREILILLALANVWALIACALGAQVGFGGGFLFLVFIGFVYFVFGTGYTIAATSAIPLERTVYVAPASTLANPIVHWIHAANDLEQMSGRPMGLFGFSDSAGYALGRVTPYGWTAAGALALLALALGGRLLVGPYFLPAAIPPEERRGRKRAEGFGSWFIGLANLSTPRIFGRKDYPWREIIERFYQNSPRWLTGRVARYQFAVSCLWWVLLIVIVTDIAGVIAHEAGGPDARLLASLIPLAIFGLLPAFHFTRAARGPAPKVWEASAPSWSAQAAAYGVKMAILFGMVIYAGAGFRLGGEDGIAGELGLLWPLRHVPGPFLFVLLVVANQAVVQIWFSSRAREARQAVALGMLHAVILWLAPFLVWPAMWWLRPGWDWVGQLAGLSPMIGLLDAIEDVNWWSGNYWGERLLVDPHWALATCYLAVETVVAAACAAAARKRGLRNEE